MTTDKQDTTHPVDKIRRAIGETALALLADMPYADLTVEKVIAAANVDAGLAHGLFHQVLDMVETGLANIDADLATQLAQD
ncbi:MAG: hypothetical protein ACPH6D_05920, partial [Candidatus Puniceispirillales bacterium]